MTDVLWTAATALMFGLFIYFVLIRLVGGRCAGLHPWSRWGAPKQLEAASFNDVGVMTGLRPVTVQERSCIRCGKLGYRRMRA